MSKASKWAEAVVVPWALENGILFQPYLCDDATPKSLCCEIKDGEATTLITVEEALSLASWLIDTFGEPDGKASSK